MNRCLVLVVGLYVAAARGAADGAWAAGNIVPIALSGQTAPGTAGATFAQFSAPDVNAHGDLALRATLTEGVGDTTTATNEGVWLAGGGTLTQVARKGVRLAGGVDEAISSFFSPGIDDAKRITFFGNVQLIPDGGFRGTARFVARPNGPSTMMRQGGDAPGLPAGSTFTTFPVGPVEVTPSGRSAIDANSSQGSGIWLQHGGGLTLGLLLTGTPAPGVVPAANFSGVRLGLDINDAGELAFESYVGDALDYGIWSTSGGTLRKVTKLGEQAPGAPAGAVFSRLYGVEILENGAVAFNAELGNGAGGVTSDNDEGLWIERGGSLQLLARSGMQAPGAPAGVVFDLFNGYQSSGDGLLFYARTRDGAGPAADGLWSSASGSLKLVARAGDQAPGLANGVQFGFFGNHQSQANELGQAAFFGQLQHDAALGIGAANDSGIWAHDAQGTLRLIVAEGRQLEVAPNDLRTVSFLRLGPSINDRGQFSFVAEFTDGSSGAFLARAVPEPQALVLVAAAAVLLGSVRRLAASDLLDKPAGSLSIARRA
jgi:hypothetical protein